MSSGANRSRRNQPAIKFPTLYRDIEGLFSTHPSYVQELEAIEDRLFRNPRFNTILPGLGLLASRICGYEGPKGSKQKATALQQELLGTIPFTVQSIVLIKKKLDFHTVELRIDDRTTGLLNEERLKALNHLGGAGLDEFRGIAIASATSPEGGRVVIDGLEGVLSLHPEACNAALLPAVLGEKSNK